MSNDLKEAAVPEVPSRIFEKFLWRLEAEGQPAELIVGLRKVLMENRDLSEAAIRAAILPTNRHS